MPLIDIQVLEGVFTREEKGQMIEKVTEAFGQVAGKTMQESTSVRIHEIQSGSWGFAGTPLTTEYALNMKAKR